jgi:tRNA-dihydrouridine synthase 2
VIANGGSNEIKTYEDIAAFKASCGVSSVMLARVAMWNCSIFRPEGMLPLDTVLRRFLEIVCSTILFTKN